jgi:hypothetical protein
MVHVKCKTEKVALTFKLILVLDESEADVNFKMLNSV